MDQNNLNRLAEQFIQGSYPSKSQKEQITGVKELTDRERVYKDQEDNKKAKPKKHKRDKGRRNESDSENGKVKDRNTEQLQQHRLHQQALSSEETKVREQEEAIRDYWREAILLSEVIGPPVAKRRRAQRTGRM